MSSKPPRPLPHLPLEVKGHILRFCDPSTLAVTSRVSLAFLELSIPILHDDIHVRGLETTEKLLCSRANSPPSALDSILSLRHVRALTIVSANDDDETLSYSVPLDRLANSSSLAVSRLTLDFGNERYPHWEYFARVFDPETVRIHAAGPEPNDHVTMEMHSLGWHRLRSIEFSGCCTADDFLGGAPFVHHEDKTKDSIPLVVTYDLPDYGPNHSLYYWIFEDLVESGSRNDMFAPTSRLAGVVFRVATEVEREKLTEKQTMWFEDLSEPERARRLALIKYEFTEPAPKADASR